MAAIITAAEEAAARIELEAEERLRERIAEAERAAEYRIAAAEEEAAELLRAAQAQSDELRAGAEEAKRSAANQALTTVADADRMAEELLAGAREQATRRRVEVEQQARELIADARAAAEGVRAEGLELVSNLREMGNALRSNAERLLGDVQRIHTRMTRQLDDAGPGRGSARGLPDGSLRDRGDADHAGDGPLDVPEFIPPA